MDKIPSSQFRTTYASLKQPALVTVNGHIIGTWVPVTWRFHGDAAIREEREAVQTLNANAQIVDGPPSIAGFNTRPFTPVPKHKGK